LAKSNLFLISGVAHRLRGTYQLKKLGGLYRAHPWLSIMFIVSAMSLAGIPPLSGFFGKFALVWAGLESGSYLIVAVALFVSILTLFSMTKIWAAAFWSPAYAPDGEEPAPDLPGSHRDARWMMVPVVVLAALTVAMGVGAEYFFGLSMRAAEQLMDPAAYVDAVLGGGS
jgi:multicomponent Na+:H+ antiporter subunit D